jgi:hypothetical protein
MIYSTDLRRKVLNIKKQENLTVNEAAKQVARMELCVMRENTIISKPSRVSYRYTGYKKTSFIKQNRRWQNQRRFLLPIIQP